ncbi:PAS domain-containing sensor histidine kinase [Bradyrhizobium oropedii]|uniref:PAS domain-containing sensor histidine kinase n=1 Tax=Bradyrhizobium oropedii TaxID=1571201 RepID=UPI0030843FA4
MKAFAFFIALVGLVIAPAHTDPLLGSIVILAIATGGGVAFVLDLTERKRTEKALQTSEDELRQIVEAVPGLIWSMDPDGNATHISRRILDYSGMRFEDFTHRDWVETFIHPDDVLEVTEHFRHTIQAGKSYRGEWRLRQADGEFRWHRTLCEPLRDREGCIIQWYGLSIDIDEAKKAEEQLRRSEAWLAQAQKLSHVGNWVYNATTLRYSYWSDESYRTWGFDPLQGLPSRDDMWQRIHPDDRNHVWEAIQEAVRQRKDFAGEFRIVLPDGTVKHLEGTSHHTYSSLGALVEVFTTTVDVTNRKRTEQAVRERDARIRRLVEANIIGVMLWDLDGQVLEANDAWLRMVGYDRDDLLAGRLDWKELTVPECRERDTQRVQKYFGSGQFPAIEKEYIRKDGTRIPVLIGAVSFQEDGNQGISFVLDLTERKHAEEALRESEYKLRQIVEAVPGLVWSMSPDGKTTHISRRFLDYAGVPFENFGHRDWAETFLRPEDLSEFIVTFRHAIQTGTPYQAAIRLRRADGVFRWHHARCEPLRDQEGRIVQWYGLAVEVDEAKKAEEQLRRGEAWLAQAQRISQTGTRVFNPATSRYSYWSDENYRIWGFDPQRGLPDRGDIWRRVHPDDLNRVWDAVQEAVRLKRDLTIEHRILLPNGAVKYLEANYHMFSSFGTPGEVFITTADVTQRRRAQDERERLRQLESDIAHINRVGMMGELAASLSHEILHPIATARNNARAGIRFLEMDPPNLNEVREALDCVVRDADRAKDIVGRIRSQIKKAPPRKERFDLNEAINEVIVMVRSATAKNGISVSTRLMDGPAAVQGDRVQLQQVLMNLMLNAVEAMGAVEDGPRELSIRSEKGESGGTLIAVHDSGPGIDPVNRDRVFEPFFTTKTSGVGMGLSICQSIINGHGGRLWISANEPRGAVFQFTLPATQEDL